ncbi:Lysophospholipase, alpha-beta hydrolase superfamily [Arboricoccus pini]|uniref:Lysophospholipase, alpha-beta hydrolase superfamily n=1 Tax=Arboricoccus pini TaxID=1963835 RepID=A0A212R239_9PROT|nr:alpha/beta hydrolase [Arboricoccus pini]SNB66073.1 Lysophospholipase, alpha-beta hydrolase superfamily [Arboricoccus pini]
MSEVDYLKVGAGYRLAFERIPGDGPTLVFLSGLRSDLTGSKASHLADLCRSRGQNFLRFDYRGHGRSEGLFEEHGIGDWHADTMAMLEQVVDGPFILVGSSMGGWQALLAGLRLPQRIRGLIGIAAAPDFTARVVEPALDAEARATLARDGKLLVPNPYGEPLPLTAGFMRDAARHLVMQDSIAIRCPVHLLHGQEDREVPWSTALELASCLESRAVTVELVKDGDHRLSRPDDLYRLEQAVDRVMQQADL